MRRMRTLFAIAVLASLSTVPSPEPPTPSPDARQQAPAPAVPTCTELATALTALMRNDARVRDWANLARYREANRPLPTEPARVVFMGDSITDFWPQRVPEFFAGKPYVGRGISGQTTPQMLVRFRRDVIDLQPRVVVILAGTNDIAGNTGAITDADIQGNLASMAQLAKANGISVVLASITPVSAYHTSPTGVPQTSSRPMTRIRAINAWIKEYAAKNGHTYLDYFSAMVDEKGVLREDLSADDLHPNMAGYAVMGPLAQQAVAAALR